jgi:tRNA threonylcarbamoyl adenosine modification protein YeaZ
LLLQGAWLGIDTLFGTGGAAVLVDGRTAAEFSIPHGSSTSEGLLGSIDRVMKAAGLEGPDLRAVCFPLGPGSYTGLRIAAATAHGLAAGWGVSMKGVPTLRLLAFGTGSTTPVLAALRARKGEVFAALYRSSDPVARELMTPGVYLAGDVLAGVSPHAPIGVGSGRSEIPSGGIMWVSDSYDSPSPGLCARLGAMLAEVSGFDEFPEPLYLRGFMEKAEPVGN